MTTPSTDLQHLTLAKGHHANSVRHLMNDQRSLDAVDAAIAFGEGKITLEELDKAADKALNAVDAAYNAAFKNTADSSLVNRLTAAITAYFAAYRKSPTTDAEYYASLAAKGF